MVIIGNDLISSNGTITSSTLANDVYVQNELSINNSTYSVSNNQIVSNAPIFSKNIYTKEFNRPYLYLPLTLISENVFELDSANLHFNVLQYDVNQVKTNFTSFAEGSNVSSFISNDVIVMTKRLYVFLGSNVRPIDHNTREYYLYNRQSTENRQTMFRFPMKGLYRISDQRLTYFLYQDPSSVDRKHIHCLAKTSHQSRTYTGNTSDSNNWTVMNVINKSRWEWGYYMSATPHTFVVYIDDIESWYTLLYTGKITGFFEYHSTYSNSGSQECPRSYWLIEYISE